MNKVSKVAYFAYKFIEYSSGCNLVLIWYSAEGQMIAEGNMNIFSSAHQPEVRATHIYVQPSTFALHLFLWAYISLLTLARKPQVLRVFTLSLAFYLREHQTLQLLLRVLFLLIMQTCVCVVCVLPVGWKVTSSGKTRFCFICTRFTRSLFTPKIYTHT